jgi:hypothetical protein
MPMPAVFVTASVTVVDCVRLPLVPVIVSVEVPAGVVPLVVTDSVVAPEPLTVEGAKLAVVPVGSPVTLKLTAPLKPFKAPMVSG